MDAPTQTTALPPPKPSGCGCLGAGCLTLFVIGLIALVLMIASAWFFFTKAINTFTSAEPAQIALEMPTDEQFVEASTKLNDLRSALRTNQPLTVAFTAAEVNALLARHPDFVPRKGKGRVAIADSLATVEMSVPLDTIELPGLKHRWFNGSANFTFLYAQEGFEFDPRWIEANGHRFTGNVLGWFSSSFNRNFTSGFEKSVQRGGASDFWRNVKTMTLEGDQLVIITKGAQ